MGISVARYRPRRSAEMHSDRVGAIWARDELNQVETALDQQPKISPEPLWIVLIGHGTYDGRQAKFNLRGPDLTAEQLAQWLSGFRRTVVIINCASASSPFMNALAGEHRIIITSTKSGYQYNFSRFGKYLAQTVGDPQADLDKDGQTSLLEAFLLASSRVAEFYRQEARLATEEALLDDNGDGRGTPASWFRGVRAVKKAKDDAPVDGMRAHQLHLVRSVQEQRLTADQRVRRDALERSWPPGVPRSRSWMKMSTIGSCSPSCSNWPISTGSLPPHRHNNLPIALFIERDRARAESGGAFHFRPRCGPAWPRQRRPHLDGTRSRPAGTTFRRRMRD